MAVTAVDPDQWLASVMASIRAKNLHGWYDTQSRGPAPVNPAMRDVWRESMATVREITVRNIPAWVMPRLAVNTRYANVSTLVDSVIDVLQRQWAGNGGVGRIRALVSFSKDSALFSRSRTQQQPSGSPRRDRLVLVPKVSIICQHKQRC